MTSISAHKQYVYQTDSKFHQSAHGKRATELHISSAKILFSVSIYIFRVMFAIITVSFSMHFSVQRLNGKD